MPPRHQTLPPAQTSSAREAQKSFYCSLCSKGYSRMNEYEAHLSSYDHSHKQRLKDMKAMVRDPNAGARARKAEAKAEGMVSIKLPGQGGASGPGGAGFKKGGFKKSGFKNAFGSDPAPVADKPAAPPASQAPSSTASSVKPLGWRDSSAESDTEDEGYDLYDPRYPTD
ncbi:Zinc finger, double-stranded RNA binding protein [Moelleriella libera RCEF 2490]|uniref:Zinc finger, double-stranded RNA binding protein n=1 Tax=Moelleriella libera RCEF 2490 TaxID=1081109 RepID=A0A166N975_9HYPO|nr:Zinc finger, double-stranded RNA binding protein [Moelleriella libera RCEF 2490]